MEGRFDRWNDTVLLAIERGAETAKDVNFDTSLETKIVYLVLARLVELGLLHQQLGAGVAGSNVYSVSVQGDAHLRVLEAAGALPELKAVEFVPAGSEQARPSRDACPLCGVRGDIGCRHRAAGDPAPKLSVSVGGR